MRDLKLEEDISAAIKETLKEIPLNGELIITVFPGIEYGSMKLSLKQTKTQ